MIGVGFSGPKVALSRIPGWEPDSYAYHGDDGQTFANTTSGKPYGQKFSTLDVVGCGVNFRTNTAFFTKNGTYQGEQDRAAVVCRTNNYRPRLQGPQTKHAVLSRRRYEEAR